MELTSKNLNVVDTANMNDGSSSNMFISNNNLNLPDVLPTTSVSSDKLIEFENYLKGGDQCNEIKENKSCNDPENNYNTPTKTPDTILNLDNDYQTPDITPLTSTNIVMKGGDDNQNDSTKLQSNSTPSTSEIFSSISK